MTTVYGGGPPKPPPPPKEAPCPPDENTLELVISNKHSACRHPRVMIDAKGRTVDCQVCKAILDPFDALLIVADNSSRLSEHLQWGKRATSELQTQEAQLRAVVSKLKGELRKLGIPFHLANTHDPERMAKWSGIPADTLQRAKALDERYPTRKPKAKLRSISGGKVRQ